MSFHMPSSWYDPPEYALQSQAEEIYDRNLFGLYEINLSTNEIIHYDLIPDEYGTKDAMDIRMKEITEDDPDEAKRYVIAGLSFETCCEIAEREYGDSDSYYDDYKYDLWKESQPDDDYDY